MTLQAIGVVILNVATQESPPATHIEYEVRNEGSSAVWLVHDQWLVWKQDGDHIELSFKRGVMRADARVFGYFPPLVVRIEPGRQLRETVELRWPVALDPLWNDGTVARPPPGTYLVSVRVGYGTSETPESPATGENVEAPVLRWQHEAVSTAVAMVVPEY